jgi:hypothetical protein
MSKRNLPPKTEIQRWRHACIRFAKATKMRDEMSTQDDESGVLWKMLKSAIEAMYAGDLNALEEAVKHPWREDW